MEIKLDENESQKMNNELLERSLKALKQDIKSDEIAKFFRDNNNYHKKIQTKLLRIAHLEDYGYFYSLGLMIARDYEESLIHSDFEINKLIAWLWKKTRKTNWRKIDKYFCDGFNSINISEKGKILTSYDKWIIEQEKEKLYEFPSAKDIKKMKEYFGY